MFWSFEGEFEMDCRLVASDDESDSVTLMPVSPALRNVCSSLSVSPSILPRRV